MNHLEPLHRVASEYSDLVMELSGEITPELDAKLATLTQKIDASAYVVKHFQTQQDHFKQIEEEARAARKRFELCEERLKQYIKDCLALAGVQKLQGENYRLTLYKCKQSVQLPQDVSELPKEYQRAVTKIVPATDEIRADLEAGKHIPGVTLTGGVALRITLG